MWSRSSYTVSVRSLILTAMSWMLALSSSISDSMCVSVSIMGCMSLACLSRLANESCWYFSFICDEVPCMLIANGIVECLMGLPSGRVIVWTREMPGVWKTALAILSMTRKSADVRRSWSLSIISSSGFIRAELKCLSAT